MYGHTGLENLTRWHNFLVFLVMFNMNERIQTFIYLTYTYENLIYAEDCSNY